MPANSADGVAHIEGSLKASLGKVDIDSLQQQLIASSKKVLLQKVEFQPAARETSFQLDSLRTKYTTLNPGSNVNTVIHGTKEKGLGMKAGPVMDEGGGGEGLPSPKLVLYPPGKIRLEWPGVRRVGAGLVNLGNTCFLNSTLQCLTYCPPLANYLLSGEHASCCKVASFCMLCELQRHMKRCQENNTAIRPTAVLQKLKMIARHMTWGRQEDAHEFLRYVIDAMQRSCLNGNNKLDKYSKETTVVNQIFGGFLRSQVLCLKCKERSNTYDPFMDINLDIKNVQSLQKALERYVMAETLDNDNAYNCPKCKGKVPAQKRFTIHKAPNVLTLQLKRFDFNRFPMCKISKHVAFPEKLDLRPYMSLRQGGPVMYQLFAVLVHIGGNCNSGHYYCYARAPNLMWYCLNDASVQPAGLNRVLNADAYLLFYVKVKDTVAVTQVSHPQPQQSNGTNHLNINKQKVSNGSNGGHGDLGVPVDRKGFVPFTLGARTPSHTQSKPSPSPSSIPMPGQRDKISFDFKSREDKEKQFGVKPKAPATVTSSASLGDPEPDNKDDTSERIVLTIKKGKVYHGSLEDLKDSSQVNGRHKQGLVPYNGESSDDDNSKPSTSKDEPVFDQRLNATVNVPGGYKPLDQEAGYKKESSLKERKSPQKRSLTEGNILTINLPNAKINATTSWSVLDRDAQVSPSLASNSSTTSVNSTGIGWQVCSNKETPKVPVLPEARISGWTITPLKEKMAKGDNREKTENRDKTENREKGEKEAAIPDVPIKSDNVKAEESKYEDPKAESKQKLGTHMSFSALLGSCAGILPSSDSEQRHKKDKKKKKKKHKKRRDSQESPLLDVSSQKQSIDDDSSDKHTKEESNRQRYESDMHKPTDTSKQEDESCYKKDEDLKHSSLKDSIKYKSREDKYKSDGEEARRSKSSDDTSSHRHRSGDDSDHGKDASSHKRKLKDEEYSSKKKKYSDDEDDAYIWVEKTKESLIEHKPEKKVPVQAWDHHVKDGYKKKDPSPASLPKWDGTRSSNVVWLLEKSNSKGYGANVMTWDGGRTELDQDAAREAKQAKKRSADDDYEEDLDRGKIKKVKSYHESADYDGNPFQKYQDYKASDEKRRFGSYHHSGQSDYRDRSSGYHTNGHGYYRNGHGNGHGNGHFRSGFYHNRHGSGNRSFKGHEHHHSNNKRW